MSAQQGSAIICTACGADTFVLRQPLYEGFQKVGETFSCASCGHVFESVDQVPYKTKQVVRIFTENDQSPSVNVFDEEEGPALCRYCVHYVVNPFTQWCGVHRREVQATDTCDRFERKPADEETA